MEPAEIKTDYEWNTGQVIIRRFKDLDPLATPAVLVANHAPFCWGPSVIDAAHTAVVLEEIAHMAYLTASLRAEAPTVTSALHEKHFYPQTRQRRLLRATEVSAAEYRYHRDMAYPSLFSKEFHDNVVADCVAAREESLRKCIPVSYHDWDSGLNMMEYPDGRKFEIRFIPGAPKGKNFEILREVVTQAA